MIEIKAVQVGEGWESKDIYLRKSGEKGFVGLHSTGMTGENGKWNSLEAWLNLYDDNKKFVCSQSRIFGPLEEVAEELLQDGWQIVFNF